MSSPPSRPPKPTRIVRFATSLVESVSSFLVETPQTRRYRPYADGKSVTTTTSHTRAEPTTVADALVRRWARKYRPSRSYCYGQFKGRFGESRNETVIISPPPQPELTQDSPQDETPPECAACSMGLNGLPGDPNSEQYYHMHSCWLGSLARRSPPLFTATEISQPEHDPPSPRHLQSPLPSPSGEGSGGNKHVGAFSVFQHGSSDVSRRPT